MTMDYGIGFTWDDNLTHNKLLAAAEEAQAIARAAEEAAEKARLASEEAEEAAKQARDLAERAADTAEQANDAAQQLAEAIAEVRELAVRAGESAADAGQIADEALSTANDAASAADAAAASAAQNATDIAAVDNALESHIVDKAAGVHGSATAATANTIAMRGTGGTLNVGTPTAAAHAATKDYVDAADSAVLAVANAAAGAAESAALTAAWTGITGKPSTYPPSTHKITHAIGGGDAIAPADIGAAAISHTTPVATASATGHVKPGTGMSVDAAGAMSVLYGTAAGTACQGNDSRLTDARTPAKHASTHNTDGSDAITSLNASVITSGTIDIARLPAGALERLKIVATDAARYALTTADVQTGDTVQVTATKIMYRVVDDAKLSTAAGYVEYTAARASAVPWSGVEGKPSDFVPAKHAATHKTGGGDALAPADIGAAAISHTTPVATASATGHVKPGTGMSVDAAGAMSVLYGTAAGTACQGNDSRLTNARTPTAHAATHKTGGTDALAPADIGAAAASHTTPVATASATGHVKPGTGMSVDAAGALAVKYGTAAGTACQGNDSRLTNTRTPTAHVTTHKTGGTDALAPADIGAVNKTGDTMTGELVIQSSNFLRGKTGTHGAFFRIDGSNLYLMLTASGDPNGSWTTSRPLTVNLSSGICNINGNALTATKLATARTINNETFDGSKNISINKLVPINITGQTVNVDDFIYTNGYTYGQWVNHSDTGAANITSIPLASKAFLFELISPRLAALTDFVQMQRITYQTKQVYERWITMSPLTGALTYTNWVLVSTAGLPVALANSRTFITNLASTAAGAFNGTANASAGVTGVLPITNGGTNASTAAVACANIGAVAKAGDAMTGNLNMNSNSIIQFANSTTNPKINLYSTAYAMGIQNSTLYLRSGGVFRFYKGGAHQATGAGDGGTEILTLDSGSAVFNGSVTATAVTTSSNIISKNAAGTSQSYMDSANMETPYINLKNGLATGLQSPYIRFQPTRADGTLQNTSTYIQAACDLLNNPVKGTTADSALLIRAGGMLYCGSGESANNVRGAASGTTEIPAAWGLFTAKLFDDSEQAFFSSDGVLYLITNANTITNSKMVQLDTGGSLVPGQNNVQNLGSAANKWANVYGTTFQGNALTAAKWQTPRTLSLTGAVTGSASVDGSGNVSIATTAGSGMAATPKAASGVGQWGNASSLCTITHTYISGVAPSKYSGVIELPAGGTWAYFFECQHPKYKSDPAGQLYISQQCGVKAGGTVLVSRDDVENQSMRINYGFCWRVA